MSQIQLFYFHTLSNNGEAQIILQALKIDTYCYAINVDCTVIIDLPCILDTDCSFLLDDIRLFMTYIQGRKHPYMPFDIAVALKMLDVLFSKHKY